VCAVGTPDEQSWPGVTKLPDFKSSFPRWKAQNLGKIVTRLDADGVDILTVRNSSLFRLPKGGGELLGLQAPRALHFQFGSRAVPVAAAEIWNRGSSNRPWLSGTPAPSAAVLTRYSRRVGAGTNIKVRPPPHSTLSFPLLHFVTLTFAPFSPLPSYPSPVNWVSRSTCLNI